MTAKDIVKISLNLVAIYLIGGLILAFVYSKTSPIIFIKNKEEKEAALKKVMPEADRIEELGTWEPHEKHATYYIAKVCEEEKIEKIKDAQTGDFRETKKCIKDKVIGYVVEGFGKGYSSYINVLVAVDKNFVVKKIAVLHHGETPGLGDEIERDYFLNQFDGKTIEHLVVIKMETKDNIQAISGATISSRAVAEDGVRNGVKMLIDKFSNGVKG